MRMDVLTLFPEMFPPVCSQSILGRANENRLLEVQVTNIRDFTLDKHKKTDEYPFGGGAGMVMTVDPIFRSLRSIQAENQRIIYMSPRGRILDQPMIEELAELDRLVILCGHYEGVDQRVLDYWKMEEVSIGDYILTGGELPAMVLIDSVARLIPDVLGSQNAHDEESIYSGLLEYPQYTKPRQYEGLDVPEVLVGGNHKWIHLWQFEQSLRLTKERRPDLFQTFLGRMDGLDKDERKIVGRFLEDENL